MISVDTTSRHEPVEETRALHKPALRFTGWHLWYGKATGRYWALSPTWCREHIGLIEADTPAELAAQIQNIENYRPRTDDPVPSDESAGGDRDGSTTPGRTRRRAR
ncbi:hypothetical protein ACIBF6_00425 [Streptosporangium amethystogenes]|uniref:hypothetical protein n=1 Tax=Streptosporangium amethystogenes TaxID=2002 RepID=UPI00379CF229